MSHCASLPHIYRWIYPILPTTLQDFIFLPSFPPLLPLSLSILHCRVLCACVMVCCMCDLVGEYVCLSMPDVFHYYPIFSLKGLSLTSLFAWPVNS